MGGWIETVVDRLGVFGVALLVAAENIIPPIPSELVLPLAGAFARRGLMNPFAVWAAATVGALVGALLLYWLAARLGYDRLRRLSDHSWFIIASPEDLDRGCELFNRHGSWIVAGGRCVPVIRSLVSLPAGLVGMPVVKFSLLTTAGSAVWNAVFIAAGYALAEKWHAVEKYTDPIGWAVVGLLVIVGAAMVQRRRARARAR